MNKLEGMIIKIIKAERKKLSEIYSLQNLEKDFYQNKKDILLRMNQYGFNSKSVKNIRNYYDLATILGVDSRELKDVDLQVYSDTLYSLLTGRWNE